MPIRVLHLIKTFELGGAETNLRNLIAATNPDRVEAHIGYSYGGPFEEAFIRSGTPLFRYAEKSCRIASAESAAIVWRLASYIRKHKIDIVHTHNFNAHVWGLAAAKLSGVRLVEHVHDFRYMPPEEYRRRRGSTAQFGFAPRFARFSDRTVVLTHVDELTLEKLHVPRERVRRIPNGIPASSPKTLDPGLRARFQLPESARVILTPARLSPEKNIDLVVRIAADVVRAVSQACFVIAGTGPEEKALREEVSRRQLDSHFRFIGFFPDMNHLLGMAEVFCLPSFLELHSIALLEALQAGVACAVSAQTGCHDEFLKNGENAVVCDPFMDEGWAAGIVSLLKDDNLRGRVGEAGRKLCAERFTIARTAGMFEALYEEWTHGQH